MYGERDRWPERSYDRDVPLGAVKWLSLCMIVQCLVVVDRRVKTQLTTENEVDFLEDMQHGDQALCTTVHTDERTNQFDTLMMND